MARDIDNQVETKRPSTMDITKICGTVGDLRNAFNHMQDLCMPGLFFMCSVVQSVAGFLLSDCTITSFVQSSSNKSDILAVPNTLFVNP